MVKGVIFDFDGVILDTEKYHYQAWRKAFQSVGYELSQAEYEPLKSTGKQHIIEFVQNKLRTTFSSDTIKSLSSKKAALYSEYETSISEQDFISGVLDFIKDLKTNDIKIAVASSSSTATMFIQKFNIRLLFDVIIDGNTNCKKKPEPDIFVLTLEKLGLLSSECLVFEDSLAGITAANRAGIKSIYVGQTRTDLCKTHIRDFTGLNFKSLIQEE